MKLIRYGIAGQEKPGVQINGQNYSLTNFHEDYTEAFFASNGLERLRYYLNTADGEAMAALPEDIRLGSPVARPSKIICVGMNYASHAKETNAPIPEEPILFFKSTTALTGPNDEVMIPKGSQKTDWEVELAVVIKNKASYIDEADALQYIAGYCVHNDYSERAYQLERGGQWVKGKSCDTFAPLGPYLTTTDEISDVHNLNLWLKVNGTMMQQGNTADLIFSIPYLVYYISQFMTLLPGDIISTGTPHGVGLGIKPHPVFLKPGDVVACGIDNLGSITQHLVAYKK